MADRKDWREVPARNRLESWLVRKIQGGGLKALPHYHPLLGRANQCPEQYARTLLAGIRQVEGDPFTLERLRDDGRAFRSWAETALASVGQGLEARNGHLYRGVVV